MSDLAPFVAAAIRDKVVEDLQKENTKLTAKLTQQAKVEKSRFEAFQTISLVGCNSKSKKKTAVVYSKNKMTSMETNNNRNESAITLFACTPCKVSMLQQVRLRIGDCCVPWQLDHCTVRMRDGFQTWWIEDHEKKIAFRFLDQLSMKDILRQEYLRRSLYGAEISFGTFWQILQDVAPTASLRFLRLYIRNSAFVQAMKNACQAGGNYRP